MQIVPLDLTSDPLHYVASVTPPDLGSPRRLLGYLRLFCGAIASEDGRFRVVTSRDEVALVDGVLDHAAERTLAQIRRPRIMWQPAGDGASRKARIVAHVLYDERLFRATYEIEGSRVAMVEDADLGALPLRYELIRPPFRSLLAHARPSAASAGGDAASGAA
jgi:hypothetical protein